MENILSSIKSMLNIELDDTDFDDELLLFINAAISELIQGGVGPQSGLVVDNSTNWLSFSDNTNVVSHSKMYVFCKTKLTWDPPSNSFVCNEYSKRAEESFWRAYLEADELRRKEENDGGN